MLGAVPRAMLGAVPGDMPGAVPGAMPGADLCLSEPTPLKPETKICNTNFSFPLQHFI